MKLVVFRMEEDLFLAERDECNAHVEEIIFVLLIHEEVEYLVDQWHCHVPEYISSYFAKTVSIS